MPSEGYYLSQATIIKKQPIWKSKAKLIGKFPYKLFTNARLGPNFNNIQIFNLLVTSYVMWARRALLLQESPPDISNLLSSNLGPQGPYTRITAPKVS